MTLDLAWLPFNNSDCKYLVNILKKISKIKNILEFLNNKKQLKSIKTSYIEDLAKRNYYKMPIAVYKEKLLVATNSWCMLDSVQIIWNGNVDIKEMKCAKDY